MNKDTIIQFECFETVVPLDEFLLRWEYYAKRFSCAGMEVTLQKQAGTKNRFKYISQHKCPQDDFHFDFMKGRNSDSFPQCNVKVVQAGGYTPLQIECMHDTDIADVKIMVFIAKPETDLAFYKNAPDYRYLNIYQSYYESCIYTLILEFFADAALAHDFISWVKVNIPGAETGIYKECLVLQE